MKWHNTKDAFPGYKAGKVLARCIIDDVINKPHYIIAQYVNGFWHDAADDLFAEKDGITISHWTFIEDSF